MEQTMRGQRVNESSHVNRADGRLERIVWTWDAHLCDITNATQFLENYTLTIDFVADLGYDAIIIWGFLRDSHGGVDAARQLATYAKSRGVRILPGIGLFSYGGVYCEGSSPYSLARRIADAPEAAGQGLPGCAVLCPSKADNFRWYRDGLSWLYETIPQIGGVHFETGDSKTNMCWCPACREATAAERNRGRDYSGSVADMLRMVPPLADHIRQLDPNTWPTYATCNCYWSEPTGVAGNWENVLESDRLALLRDMPPWIITNWCKGLWEEFDPPAGAAPPSLDHNWANVWFNPSWGLAEHRPAPSMRWAVPWTFRSFNPRVQAVHRLCARARLAGLQGIVLEGGYLPSMPDNELTLMAAGRFGDDPNLSVDGFLDEVLPALYGDRAASKVRDLVLVQEREAARQLRGQFLATVMPFHHNIFMGGYGWFPDLDPGRAQRMPELIDEQLARLDDALRVATAAGTSRLARVRPILCEQRVIADWIRRDPGLAFLKNSVRLQHRKLKEIADRDMSEHLKLFHAAAVSWRSLDLPLDHALSPHAATYDDVVHNRVKYAP